MLECDWVINAIASQLTGVIAPVFGYLEYCHANPVATLCGLLFSLE